MRLFAAALMAAFFVSACQTTEPAGTAKTDQVCPDGEVHFEPWAAGLLNSNPGLRMGELTGPQRDNVVRRFNAVPPPTNYDPEHVYLFARPQSVTMVLAFVNGDCAFMIQPLDASGIRHLFGPSA